MMLELFKPENLTMLEQTKLQQYEAVIERGLQTFVDVGQALMAIRDEGLYRPHQTFDEYCRERWNLSYSSAYAYIEAAKVVENLQHAEELPGNVRQALPLSALAPDDQRAAWQEAIETAPDGKITGAHVAAVVEKYKQPEPQSEVIADEPEPEAPTLQTLVSQPPNRAYKNSSESNEWYTPRSIIDMARRVMGGIDLDPASSLEANETVQADHIYTIDDNALMQSWFGRVWLNPPYGNDVEPFIDKLLLHVQAGDVSEALLLVAARTDTAWFRKLRTYPRCFLWGRLKFINGETGEPGDAAGFPSMIVYLGEQFFAFVDEFKSIGDVYTWWKD